MGLGWLLAGFAGSWLGDVALMLEGFSPWLFMVGLGCFLLAHLCYIVAFWRLAGQAVGEQMRRNPWAALPLLAFGLGLAIDDLTGPENRSPAPIHTSDQVAGVSPPEESIVVESPADPASKPAPESVVPYQYVSIPTQDPLSGEAESIQMAQRSIHGGFSITASPIRCCREQTWIFKMAAQVVLSYKMKITMRSFSRARESVH